MKKHVCWNVDSEDRRGCSPWANNGREQVAKSVANAEPDGYTLLYSAPGPLVGEPKRIVLSGNSARKRPVLSRKACSPKESDERDGSLGDSRFIRFLNRKPIQALVAHLRRNCILATSLNYPVVPKGEEEIRFQISADHTSADIHEALAALASFAG